MDTGDLRKMKLKGDEPDSPGVFVDSSHISKLVHGLPVMVYRYLVDDGNLDFVSDGALVLTGYQPVQLTDKGLFFNQVIHSEDRDRFFSESQAVLPGTRYKLEYRIVTAQGEEKWVLDQGQCLLNPIRRRVLEGVLIDISQYKRAEEEMKNLSFHDQLTGLYNRNFFEEELRRVDTERQLPLSLILADVNGLKIVNDAFGHQRGDELLRATADLLRRSCRKEDIISRWGGDEFVILMPQTSAEAANKLCLRIKKSIGSFAHKFLKLGVAVGFATKVSPNQDIAAVFNEAENSMYNDKIVGGKHSRHIVLDSLKQEVLAREYKNKERADEVKNLVISFGQALGVKGPQLEQLELLADICDVGKLNLSEDILIKTCKLNPSEWALIRKHPEMGYRIARTFPELVPVAEAVLYHHERWDGKGYPQGLKGLQIPLFSRIMAIVHAYDAMTHPRPYGRTMTPAQALVEIQWCAGAQFDPRLVEVFVGLMRKGNLTKEKNKSLSKNSNHSPA